MTIKENAADLNSTAGQRDAGRASNFPYSSTKFKAVLLYDAMGELC